MASFTDVLLLPVTIVPRTTAAVGKAFGAALTTGGNAAVQGISMLNPHTPSNRGQSGYESSLNDQDYGNVSDIECSPATGAGIISI